MSCRLPVVDRRTRSINLSAQGNALDATVLDGVRGALRLNDFFIRLNLSDNALSDESVALLCAILKDKTYLETLELRSCALTDKDFMLYLMPAVLARNSLRVLDLNKNPGITDASVDALCRLVRESDLRILRLVGTGLTRAGGQRLAEAIEGNTALEQCELPFTVGFEILDRVAMLLSRNTRHKESAAEAAVARDAMGDVLTQAREAARTFAPSPLGMEGSPNDPDANAVTAAATLGVSRTRRAQVALARYYTSHGRKHAVCVDEDRLPRLAQPCTTPPRTRSPSLSTASTASSSYAAGTTRAHSLVTVPSLVLPAVTGARGTDVSDRLYSGLYDFGTLRASTFRSATDPAVCRSLLHLRVLDERCTAVDAHRRAVRERRLKSRGLLPSSAGAQRAGRP